MLYLIATPIGNLADITFRAIETLKICDYILCEDTRHSLHLLKHYDIQKPLKSYHKFNEVSQRQKILEDLEAGKVIGLISDAGTPGISDPGADLVKHCIEAKLPVTAIPGPCAAIQALSCSGLPTDQFKFVGFLPKKAGALKRTLQSLLSYSGTTICYESPNRLIDVLHVIQEIAPSRSLAVARELTKKFEEVVRGTADKLLEYWQDQSIKGEIVLMIAPQTEPSHDWSTLSPEEHVAWVEKTYAASRQEAIKIVAEMRGVPKREIYNHMVNLKETNIIPEA